MLRLRTLLGVLVLGVALGAGPAAAQDSAAAPDTTRAWHDTAWNEIVTRNGLRISYIFYRKADNEEDGVVVRLDNQNEYPVRYRFTIIFRGPESRATDRVEGRIEAKRFKTGANDGLFWVPFEGGRIGEVGLRGIEVSPARS